MNKSKVYLLFSITVSMFISAVILLLGIKMSQTKVDLIKAKMIKDQATVIDLQNDRLLLTFSDYYAGYYLKLNDSKLNKNLAQLKVGDQLTVYHLDSKTYKDFTEIIQLEKSGEILYPKSIYEKREKRLGYYFIIPFGLLLLLITLTGIIAIIQHWLLIKKMSLNEQLIEYPVLVFDGENDNMSALNHDFLFGDIRYLNIAFKNHKLIDSSGNVHFVKKVRKGSGILLSESFKYIGLMVKYEIEFSKPKEKITLPKLKELARVQLKKNPHRWHGKTNKEYEKVFETSKSFKDLIHGFT